MNLRLLCLFSPLLATISVHGVAPDSPSFIIENHPGGAEASSHSAATEPSTQAKTTLADGRALLAFLDGPALQVRLNKDAPVILDSRASEECAPALAAFPDGSALAVWREHGEGDLRDLRFARFSTNGWQPSARLNPDNWIASASDAIEGPAVDSRGAHVVVAWFTGAEEPRINVSTSSNAGIQWLIPNRVDDVAPIGRVSVALLDDGAQLVSWVERVSGNYIILLRRISPRGTLSVPAELARLATDPGHPRLTRIKDGDATPAQLQLTYDDRDGPVARIITLPSATLLAEADTCDCDPRPEDQRGYGIKGRIQVIDPDAGTITLDHEEIPGIMKARATTFKAAPDIIAAAPSGQRVFARTERLGTEWWLFNVRPLVTQ